MLQRATLVCLEVSDLTILGVSHIISGWNPEPVLDCSKNQRDPARTPKDHARGVFSHDSQNQLVQWLRRASNVGHCLCSAAVKTVSGLDSNGSTYTGMISSRIRSKEL